MKIKNLVKTSCLCVGAAAFTAGAIMFLVAPEKPSRAKAAPFFGRNFAHRGLHKRDRSIPENSLLAFNCAAEKGYGIELDVRLSADGRAVVFHDDELPRCCGVPGCVEIMTWDEIKKLRLFGSDEGIPLLEDVFEVVDSRVPIIIEMKRGPRNKILCTRTLEVIRTYPGPVCVQSFDPFILKWFRKNAPDLLRGQLTSSSDCLGDEVAGSVACAILSKVLLNFVSRPNYIAHNTSKKSVFVRLSETLGALRFAWTSHSPKTEETSDAIIFEYYEPQPKFK